MTNNPTVLYLSGTSELPDKWHYWHVHAPTLEVAGAAFRKRFSHEPEIICERDGVWWFAVNRVGDIGLSD